MSQADGRVRPFFDPRALLVTLAALALAAGIAGCGLSSSAAVGVAPTPDEPQRRDPQPTVDEEPAAAVEPPGVFVTFELHMDPMPQSAPVETRRELYRQRVENANWLLDTVEPYGARISFLSAGEFLEFCLDGSDGSDECLAMLKRMVESGGMIGTHTHGEVHAGEHSWPDLGPAPTDAEITANWSDTISLVDAAIEAALGITDPAEIAAINTARGSHLPNSKDDAALLHQWIADYGFTIMEGGPDQELVPLFGHVPFNPYRPGDCTLCEDPDGAFMIVPQGQVIGKVDMHFGIVQDGSAARKKVELLQAIANRRADTLAGKAPRIWTVGWGCHGKDIDPGSPSRAAVVDLIPWIASELVGPGLAQFGSYVELRDAFEDHEAANPGTSSFDYPHAEADWAEYPYLEWAGRMLRDAVHVDAEPVEGAVVHRLDVAGRDLVIAFSDAGTEAATADLSGVFGGDPVRRIALSDGQETEVAATEVAIGSEPVVLCAPSDCDAILGGDAGDDPVAPAPAPACADCADGQVCCPAGLPCAGQCIGDCRDDLAGGCPDFAPLCNDDTGVCGKG